MRIDINELEVLVKLSLASLKLVEGASEFELEYDNYWIVGSDDIYNLEKMPSLLEVGSLYDDINELREMTSDGHISKVGLQHLSSLLRYLSEIT